MEMTVVDKMLGVPLSNDHGRFLSGVYTTEAGETRSEHIVLYVGLTTDALLTRINSACFTGDVLGCSRCDCNWQLHYAMRRIAAEQSGLLVYHLQHEGRGNGLLAKLRSHRHADCCRRGGSAAYTELGYPADIRDYAASALILRDLGVRSVRLMSNNPHKRQALEHGGVAVLEVLPTICPDQTLAELYRWKRADFGHST